MAKPPETQPSSDVEGADRDARAGKPIDNDKADPGSQMNQADQESRGRPKGGRQADETPDNKSA